jgi:hypothetical protein
MGMMRFLVQTARHVDIKMDGFDPSEFMALVGIAGQHDSASHSSASSTVAKLRICIAV